MKTLILDGSHAGDTVCSYSTATLLSEIASRGWSAEVITLRDKKIGNCMGDLLCWLKSPGKCHIADDNLAIAQKWIESDLVILLTPITFGGYSSPLKKMVDHLIQNTLPFFTTIDGEIHHPKRYENYPNIITIGWQSEPDEQSASIFRHLAWRNAINMYSKVHVCGILYRNQENKVMKEALHCSLNKVELFESDVEPTLPNIQYSSVPATPVRRALLLVGSPRLQKSTSSSLGSYLFEQLKQQGVETETVYLYKGLKGAERMEALHQSLALADLVVLAFPLYIDTLPAPVIAILENVIGWCKEKKTQTRFATIVNSGFPQARQNSNAIASCAEFARAAGFEWMGSLALGGGEGMVHALPLDELGGRGIPLRRALEITAGALVVGQPVPDKARELFAKPFVPEWLYTLVGTFKWKKQARLYGVQKLMRSRPYHTIPENHRAGVEA